MDSKRDTILAFLKTHGHATLGEIAAHLEVSKQGALRHLKPVVQMSETPPHWARPSVPLGYHRPEWPA